MENRTLPVEGPTEPLPLMKIAVVGATGLVGREIVEILHQRKFPLSELILCASEKSKGKILEYKGTKHILECIEDTLDKKPHIALFSAGSNVSKHWAKRFSDQGCYVIDNSSCWRMDPNIKLVVPEINGRTLTSHDRLISNPNCSTIQLAMVLYPIHQKYKAKRIVISTYQSVSGSGIKAVHQLMQERESGLTSAFSKSYYSAKEDNEKHRSTRPKSLDIEYSSEPLPNINNAYSYKIDLNAIPQIDVFLENGYTKEEMKIINETQKILDVPNMNITSTCVRLPIIGGHCESVNIETEVPFEMSDIHSLLEGTTGIKVVHATDAPNQYPMPLDTKGTDDVLVGRIRRDLSIDNSMNLWIVADNIRKGAALNAVQIAETILPFIEGL